MNAIVIEEPGAIESVIYVHAHAYNAFLGGWGYVIERQGDVQEHHHKSDEGNAPRLLLIALLDALTRIPKNVPVRVVSGEEWLIKWTIKRLEMLREKECREARKKKNPDLVCELCKVTRPFVYVRGNHASSGQWPDHLKRAAELARDCDGIGRDVQYPSFIRPKKTKPLPPAERFAANQTYDYTDLPWDD